MLYFSIGANGMLSKKQQIYLFSKRIGDILGSFVGLVLLSPLFLFCILITSISSKGGPFFLQTRIGKNEKKFSIIKFRSMKKGTKEIAPYNLGLGEQRSMETCWGRFMRKTGIDEIPQLINIFFGQMSFIGPRPSQRAAQENELIVERRSYLPSPYLVRPGLTGYAQVVGRCGHNYQKKAKNDSFYVEHISLLLDCFIFWKTILWVFGIRKPAH